MNVGIALGENTKQIWSKNSDYEFENMKISYRVLQSEKNMKWSVKKSKKSIPVDDLCKSR